MAAFEAKDINSMLFREVVGNPVHVYNLVKRFAKELPLILSKFQDDKNGKGYLVITVFLYF